MTTTVEKMLCPLDGVERVGGCSVSACQFNRRSTPTGCLQPKVMELRNRGLPSVELRAKLSTLFGVDAGETEAAVRRVVSLLCLNEYFRFCFGKDLMEARARELNELAADPERYAAWKAGTKKTPFSAIVSSVAFVKTNLK